MLYNIDKNLLVFRGGGGVMFILLFMFTAGCVYLTMAEFITLAVVLLIVGFIPF
jgi:hypothetical protein